MISVHIRIAPTQSEAKQNFVEGGMKTLIEVKHLTKSMETKRPFRI